MYVGNQYTATQKHADLQDFECRSCHLRRKAVVIGVGQGTGNSAYFLDNDGAKDRAASAADGAARANARLTLSLAKCPRCGERDGSAVAWFWLGLAGKLLGSALFLWAIGGLVWLIEGGRDTTMLWIFGPIGLAMVPVVWWIESWKWTTVDGRVVFVDEE